MKMKKTLAVLLSMVLIICMMPATAFAVSGSGQVTFELSKDTAAYNTEVQKPIVSNVKLDGAAVEANSYTVDYGTGNYKDAGSYQVKVTVTVPAAVEGEEPTLHEGTKTFTVTPLDINTLTIIVPEQEEGKSVVQGEKIVFNGYQTSEFADSYDVTRSGTDAVFTGKKNLTGTKSVSFKTVPSLASAFEATVSKTGPYDGTEKPVSVYLTKKSGYTGSAYISASDYEVTPKTVVNKQPYTITITAKEGSGFAGSIVLTNQDIVPARDASSYYVSVANIPNQAYTATQLKPALEVTDYINGSNVSLKAGRDFYVTYGENNTIGSKTGSATLTFMNNYTGSRTVYFDIIDPAKDVSTAYVTAAYMDARTYSGSVEEPVLTVMKGTKTLLRNSEYEVVYVNTSTGVATNAPVNAGTYTIKIRGIGAYGGEYVYSQAFVINPRNIGDATISGLSDNYVYAGTKIEPSFSVYYPYGNALRLGNAYGTGDYYVTYGTNNTTGTTAGVIYIHGTGNFTGTKSVRFGIIGKSIAGCTASFTNGASSSNYTGVSIRPALTVKDGYYTILKEGVDYSVSYKDAAGKATVMKDAGSYTVVITGKGNYSGELALYYTVNGKPMSSAVVTLSQDSVTANGSAQKPSITSVKYGTATLKTTDYTVSYQDANGVEVTSMIKPGEYRIVLTGKGGYTGSTYATFTIKGLPQTIKIEKTAYKVYTESDPFRIKATATGDGTGFTYVSSNPSVASVSADGKVTIHKLGRAKITVTTTGMTKYDAATDDVYVKVHPDKTILSRKPWTEGKDKSFRVRWDIQEDSTMYQIRYSTSSDFKSYKTKTVTASEKYATQSTRITGLKANTKYYVQVRAIKTVTNDVGNEVKYYGKWANWRSVTTKK